MADWFKFYENDLDETRLQYAISKLPEVIPVWVGILSEACRHKSGTVSWGKDEIELFGFSRRLGVSMPKVNEAVNLLLEIRYVTKSDSHITVIKWGEKQSEYCQKLTKQQNQTGSNNPGAKKLVPTVSRHTPDSVGQEERRGEEIRGDKKKASPLSPPATLAEILEAWNKTAEKSGLPKCLLISDKRRRFLNSRLKDGFWCQNWQAALVRVSKSPFLLGTSENSRGWKASFDWFITPDAVAKVMEGKYDQATKEVPKEFNGY